MKFALCAIAAVALVGPVPAGDKEKAKATAAAALALAKAAEADKKPVGTPMLTDLDKAKEKAQAQAKVLVVWVDTKPPDATVKAVDAVHVQVKELPNNGEAKCVVFTCHYGDCDRKASVNTIPSAALLKSMIDEAKKEPVPKLPAGRITDEEFFVTFEADAEELPPPDPVTVTKYEKKQVTKCYTDARGRTFCVTETVDVAMATKAAEIVKLPAVSRSGQFDQSCADCGSAPVQKRRLFRNR